MSREVESLAIVAGQDRERRPVIALANRIGHSDPATLRVYSHVFRKDDHEAAVLAAKATSGRGEHLVGRSAEEQT